MLIEALGGKCYACSRRTGLEPDHVDGCTWRHNAVSREARLRRYAEEFRSGVRLRAACRSHNGRRNQWTFGTRWQRKTLGDVIEEIEAAEREAA